MNTKEAGTFSPVIDCEYLLEQISDAFQYFASGEKTGNLIINYELHWDRWRPRNGIYQLKFVQCVVCRLPGARNGETVGTT